MPRPRWGQVRGFCRKQGYDEIAADHYDYVKILPGGVRSYTMVSHGTDAEQVPPGMWKLVWSRQLRLKSEEEFWRGLAGETVEYDVPPAPVPPAPLPAYLVEHLRDVRRFTPEQIARATREEAQDLLDAYYSRELAEPDDG